MSKYDAALKTIKTNQANAEKGRNLGVSDDLKSAVETYLLARAYVETIRPVVEGYRAEILASRNFIVSDKWRERLERWERKGMEKTGDDWVIRDDKQSYLMRDDHFSEYLVLLHKAHHDHGFRVKKDYCPLLIAESHVVDARWDIVDAAVYISGIGRDMLYDLDNLYRYIDLTVKFVIGSSDINTDQVLAKVMG